MSSSGQDRSDPVDRFCSHDRLEGALLQKVAGRLSRISASRRSPPGARIGPTARDAATLGHRVILVAVGTAAADDDRTHNATLHTIYRSFGDVRLTEEVLALIAGC